jgi:hypothetical protein
MNCPACEKGVKPLPDKPEPIYSTTATTLDYDINGTGTGEAFALSTSPLKTKETFKCCNEKCWVTEIKVVWWRS